jgi:hypothetical protein
MGRRSRHTGRGSLRSMTSSTQPTALRIRADRFGSPLKDRRERRGRTVARGQPDHGHDVGRRAPNSVPRSNSAHRKRATSRRSWSIVKASPSSGHPVFVLREFHSRHGPSPQCTHGLVHLIGQLGRRWCTDRFGRAGPSHKLERSRRNGEPLLFGQALCSDHDSLPTHVAAIL